MLKIELKVLHKFSYNILKISKIQYFWIYIILRSTNFYDIGKFNEK